MTRKEQIKKASQNELSKCPNFNITAPAFRMGAEWADRTMIDKACEWLTRELCYTARGNNFFNNKTATDEFVESFKRAMKGGEK